MDSIPEKHQDVWHNSAVWKVLSVTGDDPETATVTIAGPGNTRSTKRVRCADIQPTHTAAPKWWPGRHRKFPAPKNARVFYGKTKCY